jgi:hypothetical protein
MIYASGHQQIVVKSSDVLLPTVVIRNKLDNEIWKWPIMGSMDWRSRKK